MLSTAELVGIKVPVDPWQHMTGLEQADRELPLPKLVFRMPDGETTDQLGRNFTMLLKRLKLEKGPGGKRTLYSLRHTYITMKLPEGISPTVIAHQCGASAEMIRLHYSHLTAQMFKKELIGNESCELTKLVRKYTDLT